jgi:hypothetical protein
MSNDQVQLIIGKAATDSDFREKLLQNPHEILAGFDLTEEEREALLNIKKEDLKTFSQSLDERISKGFSNVGG